MCSNKINLKEVSICNEKKLSENAWHNIQVKYGNDIDHVHNNTIFNSPTSSLRTKYIFKSNNKQK